MSIEDYDPLLSTFVIEERLDSDGVWYSTEEAARLAASLSVRLYLKEIALEPELTIEWLESGHRKHLRRAKPAQFNKLVSEVSGLVEEGPFGRMFATDLHRKSETPALLSKLQLSHFKETLKESPAPSDSVVEIVLNDALGMSFGKAVIAAAHVAQAMLLSLYDNSDTERLKLWEASSYDVCVRWGNVETFESDVQIVDHGLTEVASGSVTAVARWNA